MSSRITSRGLVAASVLSVALGISNAVALSRLNKRDPVPACATTADGEADGKSALALERLRGEVAAFRLNVLAAQGRAGEVAPPGPSPTGTSPSPAEAGDDTAGHRDTESVFREEPIDPRWATDAAASIAAAFNAGDIQARPTSMECRSQTCRVEVVDADPLDPVYPRLERQLMGEFPNVAMNRNVDPSGRTTVTLYFSHPASTVR